MASQREKNWGWFSSAFQLPASNEPDAAVSSTNCRITEPRTDRRDYDFDEFFRRPGRGRRALRRAAIFFFRLLTKPPLRPFSVLARCLASLRTKPPNRPSATACGFFPFCFFIHPLHHSTSSPFHKTH